MRLAIESRAALSPDALTGMEANLRFAGPETMETKIFGRLTAWQNWIFIRPNAVGEKGALTSYGSQSRPEFDFGGHDTYATCNVYGATCQHVQRATCCATCDALHVHVHAARARGTSTWHAARVSTCTSTLHVARDKDLQ